MKPEISVVIPAYNAGATIVHAVASARGQEPPPLEVLVVDDGSTDDTAERAERAGARVIRQSNSGVSAARNRGVLEAAGDWIAFLDADDRWLPHKLAHQAAALARYPYAHMVFCDMQREKAGEITEPRWMLDRLPYQHLEKSPLGDTLMLIKGDALSSALLIENFIPTSSVLIRKAIIPPPGFDAEMRYCEDLEAWLRMIKNGEVLAVEQADVAYRLHDGSASAQWTRILRGNLDLLDRIQAKPALYAAALQKALPTRYLAARIALAVHLIKSGEAAGGTELLGTLLRQHFSLKTVGWYAIGWFLQIPGVKEFRQRKSTFDASSRF